MIDQIEHKNKFGSHTWCYKPQSLIWWDRSYNPQLVHTGSTICRYCTNSDKLLGYSYICYQPLHIILYILISAYLAQLKHDSSLTWIHKSKPDFTFSEGQIENQPVPPSYLTLKLLMRDCTYMYASWICIIAYSLLSAFSHISTSHHISSSHHIEAST